MVKSLYVSSIIPGFLNDLEMAYHMIIFSVILSFVICSIYIELMSLFAEAMAWICIIFVQVSIVAASIGSFYLKFWIQDYVEVTMIKKKFPESMISAMQYA